MPEQLLGTQGPALRWRQLELLRGDLGPTTIDEMYAYAESARFWPYFEQYATDWIWPQQQVAYEVGSSRGRGPTLNTVENGMLAAERIGDEKFTTLFPDTKGWDNIDFLARMMCGVRNANIKSVQGLFHGKELSDAKINNQIWALAKYRGGKEAPVRATKKTKVRKASAAGRSQGSAQPRASITAPQPSVSGHSASTAQQPSASGHSTRELSIGSEPMELEDEDERTGRVEQVESFKVPLTFDNDGDERPPPQLLESVEDDHFGSSRTLTNAHRLAALKNSATFDISQGFWKTYLIDEIIAADNNPSVLRESIATVEYLDAMADADSQRWMKAVTHDLEDDLIAYAPISDQSAVEFDGGRSLCHIC